MAGKIRLSETFPVPAKVLFEAWLNSTEHTNFTGGKAKISAVKGEKFSAWDGYISGRNVQIQPYGRIVQSWRTTDFPDSSRDSQIEILLQKTEGGTKMVLIHSDIPHGDEDKYEQGWKEHYFRPMKVYFSNRTGS